MSRQYVAFIERDVESDMYIGTVPGIAGAHTCAESIDELQVKLAEVISLCLEEMMDDEIENIPVFTGVSQIEVVI
jgi:predicted RNase H-like HicB family nuclease